MRTFAQVIGSLAEGRTAQELDETLASLVLAVSQAQKAGTLTLKIKVEPNGEGLVRIVESISVGIPQKNRGSSIFYHDQEGSLLQRDPRQKELSLKQVNTAGTGEPKRIATAGGAAREVELPADVEA